MQLPTNIILNKEQIYAEAFKRCMFDFITVNPFTGKKHVKQEEALHALTDDITEELLYGGAAGGAKSWTGCAWLLFSCILYPGTKWFIGREELNRIEKSTLVTFNKCAAEYGITSWKYVAKDNQIQFANGSIIDLLEIKFKPSDERFERFGSVEYTGGWIEEGGETHFGAYDILKTRIGRHMNDKYGILAKILVSANPKKNWMYTTFYLPFKKKALSIAKKFITALVDDNPHIDSGYINKLDNISDASQKKRLRFGEWEYDEDPNSLCTAEAIYAMFENNHVQRNGKRYITADIARFGSDTARVLVWDGWVIIDRVEFKISATTDIQDAILAMRKKHDVPTTRAIADEDGVGGGVVDNLKILGFLNNGKPFVPKQAINNPNTFNKDENYFNLQAQCGYGLAGIINKFQLYFAIDVTEDEKEIIAQELSWLKTYKSDDERKLRILPKEIVKQNIGHSPDWRDALLMRYYFEVAPSMVNGMRKIM